MSNLARITDILESDLDTPPSLLEQDPSESGSDHEDEERQDPEERAGQSATSQFSQPSCMAGTMHPLNSNFVAVYDVCCQYHSMLGQLFVRELFISMQIQQSNQQLLHIELSSQWCVE